MFYFSPRKKSNSTLVSEGYNVYSHVLDFILNTWPVSLVIDFFVELLQEFWDSSVLQI